MSFYYPLGLLGLIGIPVLIFIYIIKSKYTEQTVASTYLWELSEKFLKRKKPISKLTGIITLILQMLAVVVASFLIAQPVFIVPNSANDFYFILDGSASMNTVDEGVSRFERAKNSINEIIDESLNGSSYTLIYVGDTTEVLFEGVTDKTQAKINVDDLEAGWCSADCSSAIYIAQSYFDANRSALVYLVTDKSYTTENMALIDVSSGEYNSALQDCEYKLAAGGVTGMGKIVSYSRDATIDVAMSFSDANGEFTQVASAQVRCKADEPTDFALVAEAADFVSIKLEILQSDALAEDNCVIVYDAEQSQSRKVLFVNNTQDGTYLQSAIAASGKAQVDVVTPKAYAEAQPSGYGMYVFNGYTPSVLPTNAAIWLVNAVDGSGSGSGVGFRGYMTPRDSTGPNSYYVSDYTVGSSTQYKLLTKDLVRREIVVRSYARYSMPRGFETLLSIGGDPIVAAGLNAKNDRQVVFAFEIGNSNLGLLDNFLILVRNLMNYSFPSVLDDTLYVCGDTMSVNVVPGCESIVVTSPSGTATTLDTVDNALCEVLLNEMGTYKLNVKIAGVDTETVLSAYACVPESESRGGEGSALALSGIKENNYSDGFYDNLLVFFIVIAVALLADWGIYCYEQHQLR